MLLCVRDVAEVEAEVEVCNKVSAASLQSAFWKLCSSNLSVQDLCKKLEKQECCLKWKSNSTKAVQVYQFTIWTNYSNLLYQNKPCEISFSSSPKTYSHKNKAEFLSAHLLKTLFQCCLEVIGIYLLTCSWPYNIKTCASRSWGWYLSWIQTFWLKCFL